MSRKYRARRYELLWTQSVSLPVMRYPVGLPLPSQMWRLQRDDGGAYLFSARIGDRRWILRLRGGPHFARVTDALDRVIAGQSDAGAAVLYRVRAHESDHRAAVSPHWRLMLRLPVAIEADRPASDRKGSLKVRTTADALLVASHGDRIWTEHNDHIRRAIRTYERQRQHLSDDLNAERRRTRREREGIVERMGTLAHRHAQRMRSWLHEAASHLIGYAVRQRIAAIIYGDADRRFVAQFPWHELRQRIAEKCEVAGIDFTASGEEKKESPEP